MTDKDLLATEIVKKYALYTAGAGLIPLPFADFAAISALEFKMLRDIGNVYGVPFEADRVRPILSALIGGYASTRLGLGAGGSLAKALPGAGAVIGALSVPAFAAGLTWAIGKVFITHFASGGTFLDFDPDKVRSFFSSKPAATTASTATAAGL